MKRQEPTRFSVHTDEHIRQRKDHQRKKKMLQSLLFAGLAFLFFLFISVPLFYVHTQKAVKAAENLAVKTQGTVQALSWDAGKDAWFYEIYCAADGGEEVALGTLEASGALRREQTDGKEVAQEAADSTAAGESETGAADGVKNDGRTLGLQAARSQQGRLTATVTGLKEGHLYTYRIITVNEFHGKAYYSEAATVKDITPLGNSPELTAENAGTDTLKLTWNVLEGVSGYELSYALSEDMKDAEVISLLPAQVGESGEGGEAACTYTLSGLAEGTLYYLSLKAYKIYEDADFPEKYYSETPATLAVLTPAYVQVKTAQVDKTKPMVALTFDDGPDYGSATASILDTLKTYGAHATFFMLGDRAKKLPAITARIASEGHEVGNHTYDHSHSGEDVTEADIVDAQDAIEAACGVRPTAFRSPGGNTTSAIRTVCVKEGMPLYYWSIDTRDWETRDAKTVVANIKNNVSDGDIILMHNIYGSTAEAVKEIVPYLIENGYQLVTVSQLVYYKSGAAPISGMQYYSATDAR